MRSMPIPSAAGCCPKEHRTLRQTSSTSSRPWPRQNAWCSAYYVKRISSVCDALSAGDETLWRWHFDAVFMRHDTALRARATRSDAVNLLCAICRRSSNVVSIKYGCILYQYALMINLFVSYSVRLRSVFIKVPDSLPCVFFSMCHFILFWVVR